MTTSADDIFQSDSEFVGRLRGSVTLDANSNSNYAKGWSESHFRRVNETWFWPKQAASATSAADK
jgi:hypothetical protein